jgi:hypothetical protein
MRRFLLSAATMAMLAAVPVSARDQDKPITDRDPNAMDIAKTPITDLNVGRDNEIPPLLIEAVARPYAIDNLGKCKQLSAEIEELDALLGPDLDLPQEERDRISAGRTAKWVVSSLIPFRGLIREVSGANAQDRKVNAAIQAGLTRRGFLKGVGTARGCKYPARSATTEVIQARLDSLAAEKEDAKLAKADADKKDLAFKSEPDAKQVPPGE